MLFCTYEVMNESTSCVTVAFCESSVYCVFTGLLWNVVLGCAVTPASEMFCEVNRLLTYCSLNVGLLIREVFSNP